MDKKTYEKLKASGDISERSIGKHYTKTSRYTVRGTSPSGLASLPADLPQQKTATNAEEHLENIERFAREELSRHGYPSAFVLWSSKQNPGTLSEAKPPKEDVNGRMTITYYLEEKIKLNRDDPPCLLARIWEAVILIRGEQDDLQKLRTTITLGKLLATYEIYTQLDRNQSKTRDRLDSTAWSALAGYLNNLDTPARTKDALIQLIPTRERGCELILAISHKGSGLSASYWLEESETGDTYMLNCSITGQGKDESLKPIQVDSFQKRLTSPRKK